MPHPYCAQESDHKPNKAVNVVKRPLFDRLQANSPQKDVLSGGKIEKC
jgi:hypothetical protein